MHNNGDGTFAAGVSYTAAGSAVAVADVNGDQRLDLLSINSVQLGVMLNNGDGTFANRVTYVATPAVTLAIGDVNGDGYPDAVMAGDGTGTPGTALIVLTNKGDGTFANPVLPTVGSRPTGPALGDVNGDGKLDIILANAGDHSISVLINAGSGTFRPAVSYTAVFESGPIALGDLDGDGTLDIVGGMRNGVVVRLNAGDGTFLRHFEFAAGSGTVLGLQPAVADFDGDGRLDVVVSNSFGAAVLRNDTH
jgi:hypothetical protein